MAEVEVKEKVEISFSSLEEAEIEDRRRQAPSVGTSPFAAACPTIATAMRSSSQSILIFSLQLPFGTITSSKTFVIWHIEALEDDHPKASIKTREPVS